jgi:hypothetical protein
MLTLKTLTIFNRLPPEDQTLAALLTSHEINYPTPPNTDPSELALQLAQELDDIIAYYQSLLPANPQPTTQNSSNLLRRFSEFLSTPDYEQATILMSGFNPVIADNWFSNQPALKTIKALRMFAEYEMQKAIATYEGMVYSQGGSISSVPSGQVSEGVIKKPLDSYAPVLEVRAGSKFAEALKGMQL